MRPITWATIAALSVPTSAAAIESVPETLALSCRGFVTTKHDTQVGGSAFTPGGAVPVTSTVVTESQNAARVLVDISGDGGRIKLPPEFITSILSRSDDGWRPFATLVRGDRVIHGRFKLNFLIHSNVTIDRMTGHIDISAGLGNVSFSGDCEKYDPKAAPVPKF